MTEIETAYQEALEDLQRETKRVKEEYAARQARGKVAMCLKPVPDRAWFAARERVIENQPRPNDYDARLKELLTMQKKLSAERWQNVLDNLDDLAKGMLSEHEDLFQGWRKKDLDDLMKAIS